MYDGQKIGVIIPAFDEEEAIGSVVDAVPEFVDAIVVIDDGSTDRTAQVARRAGAVVLSHGRNRGLGAAFDTGRRYALESGVDVMVNIDGDAQFDPADIEKLIEPVISGRAGFVTASRFKDSTLVPEMSRAKLLGNRLMSWAISRLTGRRFHDVSCGFRAYSRDTLLRMNLFGDFTYTQEMFLDLAFKNIAILEVPVAVRGSREHGSSNISSNLLRYGWQTMKIIVRTLRDYRPLRLFAGIAAVTFAAALIPGIFLLVHYVRTGSFSPHKWAGFLSGFLVLLSVLSVVLGFILDMFARMRMNQEEILSILRKSD